MKLINPEVYEYYQDPTIDSMYKAIRDAAATCYQTDVEKMKLSPKDFIEKVLLKNAHTRPLEFGTVYLLRVFCKENTDSIVDMNNWINKYKYNPYSKVIKIETLNQYNYVGVTTNFRVIMQGDYTSDKQAFYHNYDKNWLNDLKYWPDQDFYNYQYLFSPRRTFVMNISRGCTDDNRTHITLSSMCESTRFCNYSKGKFGKELTFIKPYWFGKNKWRDFWFKVSCKIEEIIYLQNAKIFKYQPQQLKRLFPLGVKAELRLCGFNDAWNNFFWRRCDDHADPECKLIANQIKDLFYEN